MFIHSLTTIKTENSTIVRADNVTFDEWPAELFDKCFGSNFRSSFRLSDRISISQRRVILLQKGERFEHILPCEIEFTRGRMAE